jgi:hypothetical protein
MADYAGGFQVSGWDEATVDDLGGDTKLTKVRIAQTFTGGLAGTGAWEGVMYYRADGTAVYSGVQTVSGAIDGREGSFVAVSGGEYDGTTAASHWEIVPGSGQGQLIGISGSGDSSAQQGAEGAYRLDVEVG